jgi:hypothetical protein
VDSAFHLIDALRHSTSTRSPGPGSFRTTVTARTFRPLRRTSSGFESFSGLPVGEGSMRESFGPAAPRTTLRGPLVVRRELAAAGLPATPQHAYSMLRAAIAHEDPCILIESRTLYQLKERVPAFLRGGGGAAQARRPRPRRARRRPLNPRRPVPPMVGRHPRRHQTTPHPQIQPSPCRRDHTRMGRTHL